jgi:hypothetical protein
MTDTTTPEPVGKKFWESKTFWLNFLALIGIIVQSQTGYVISPMIQGIILTMLNTILRLVTKEPIVWKD